MKIMKYAVIMLILAGLIILAGCAPGNVRFDPPAKPAGFWAGLWHGFITLFTFVISLFRHDVKVYQVNNAGNWYNFGFILGIMIFWSGSRHSHHHMRKKAKSFRQQEWEEIGAKVEEKVRNGIKNWVEESGKSKPKKGGRNKEWEDIGKKVEEKIKRELRNWAEK